MNGQKIAKIIVNSNEKVSEKISRQFFKNFLKSFLKKKAMKGIYK